MNNAESLSVAREKRMAKSEQRPLELHRHRLALRRLGDIEELL
jgi:hypothetical protein